MSRTIQLQPMPKITEQSARTKNKKFSIELDEKSENSFEEEGIVTFTQEVRDITATGRKRQKIPQVNFIKIKFNFTIL
jgi:hypothetical protein